MAINIPDEAWWLYFGRENIVYRPHEILVGSANERWLNAAKQSYIYARFILIK